MLCNHYLNIVMRLTYIAVSSVPVLPTARSICHTSSEQGNRLSPILVTYFAQYFFSKMACQNWKRLFIVKPFFTHYCSLLIAKEITLCQNKAAINSQNEKWLAVRIQCYCWTMIPPSHRPGQTTNPQRWCPQHRKEVWLNKHLPWIKDNPTSSSTVFCLAI